MQIRRPEKERPKFLGVPELAARVLALALAGQLEAIPVLLDEASGEQPVVQIPRPQAQGLGEFGRSELVVPVAVGLVCVGGEGFVLLRALDFLGGETDLVADADRV